MILWIPGVRLGFSPCVLRPNEYFGPFSRRTLSDFSGQYSPGAEVVMGIILKENKTLRIL